MRFAIQKHSAAAGSSATRFSLSVSPTEVPPNFITTRSGVGAPPGKTGTASKSVVAIPGKV